MKTMNLSISLLLLASVLVFSMPLQAQENHDREAKARQRKEMGEKIKVSKIAFITEHVDLTPQEAEQFWPLYNEKEKRKEEITHSLMDRYKEPKEEKPEITDEEALEIMGQRLSLEGKLLAIKLEYHQKYLDIMAPTKVFKLYEAEDLFRKHLMERFRHRDGERHPEGEGRRAPEGEGRKAPYREKAEPR